MKTIPTRNLLAAALASSFLTIGGANASESLTPAADSTPDTIVLEGTLRDFKIDHPDMQNPNKSYGVKTGLVEDYLDGPVGIGKPVLASGDSARGMITGEESFNQWFRDVEGVNKTSSYSITLEPLSGSPGVFYFAREKQSSNPAEQYFFPMDEVTDGEESWNDFRTESTGTHNFFFTYELRTLFTFTPRSNREAPSQDLTFTDLLEHEGKLYVAGLSHAEFDSTLWSTTFPLGEAVATTTVEIFHGIHDQQETRAPIRAMAVVDVDGTDHLVAAYTCTPLVVFPLSGIVDGAHGTGKTIGEMGYGNTPSDLRVYTTQDAQQQPMEVLFLQNADRAAQVVPLAAVREAARGEGITESVPLNEQASLGASSIPMTNVLEVADQDPRHLAVLRRDAREGDLELISYLKGVYFRLSDFQSEYEIPGYTYAEAQQPIRQFQNMMKVDEGQSKFVVQ